MKISRGNQTHPLVSRALSHRKVIEMDTGSIDALLLMSWNSPIVVTIKYDGEHNVISWKRGVGCTTANKYGTLRKEMPVLNELASILEETTEFESAVFAGELYAIRDDGKRMPLGDVMHHIKGHKVKTATEDGVSWDITDLTPAEEGRVRLAVFDVLEIDGSPVSDDYWKKILLIGELLDGCFAVHPVIARQGDADVIKDLWNHKILEEGLEGLVVHTNGLVKVKVLIDVEMVVVGMKADGEQYPRGLAGALLLAFMAKDGAFIFSTSVNCRQDRKAWFDYVTANQVGNATVGNSPYIICKPQRILSVSALAWNIHEKADLPGYAYLPNGSFVFKGFYQGAVAREPRFVTTDDGKHLRERTDKTVNPYDLRVEQVPDYDVPPVPEKQTDASVEERNRQKLAEMFKKNPVVDAFAVPLDFSGLGKEWGFDAPKKGRRRKKEKELADPENPNTLYEVMIGNTLQIGTIDHHRGVFTGNIRNDDGQTANVSTIPTRHHLDARDLILGTVTDKNGNSLHLSDDVLITNYKDGVKKGWLPGRLVGYIGQPQHGGGYKIGEHKKFELIIRPDDWETRPKMLQEMFRPNGEVKRR